MWLFRACGLIVIIIINIKGRKEERKEGRKEGKKKGRKEGRN